MKHTRIQKSNATYDDHDYGQWGVSFLTYGGYVHGGGALLGTTKVLFEQCFCSRDLCTGLC
jgi:hypothetical protein